VIIVIIVDVVIAFFTVDVVFIIVEFTMQQPSCPGMVTQPLRHKTCSRSSTCAHVM
jgi:hypothetical protein